MNNRLGLTYFVFFCLISCNRFLGEERAYHDNGSLHYRVPLKHGKRHGVLYQYYENGELQLKSHWVYGIKEGLVYEYFPNGNVKVEGTYRNGKAHGKFTQCFETGEVFIKHNLKNGIEVGDFCEYYKSGSVYRKVIYKDGQYHGRAYEYFQSGKPRLVLLYEKGKLLYSREVTEKGDIKASFLTIAVSSQPKVEEYVIGERYSFAISLAYPGFENSFVGIKVGELGQNNKMISSDFELVSDSLTALYEVTLQKEGKQKISGLLYEMIGENRQTVGTYPFSYEFHVVKK